MRGQANTYHARFEGTSASNTAGPVQAAQTALRKVLGDAAGQYTFSAAKHVGQNPNGAWIYLVQVTPPAGAPARDTATDPAPAAQDTPTAPARPKSNPAAPAAPEPPPATAQNAEPPTDTRARTNAARQTAWRNRNRNAGLVHVNAWTTPDTAAQIQLLIDQDKHAATQMRAAAEATEADSSSE